MKKTFVLIASLATLALASSTTNGLAKGKEVTLNGEAKCAKCSLQESKTCQTVIQVDHKGKTLNYYVVDNDVSKAFHDQVCSDTKKVTATGKVTKSHGKQQITLTKIEAVK